MSPLGQQISRLLQPEHWEEWALGEFVMEHRDSGVALWSCDTWLGFRVWRPVKHGFPILERWRLAKMAKEMRATIIARRMLTAEERAIEELLRS